MARTRRLPKEFRPLVKAAKAAGAEAINRKDGVLLRLPDGGTMMLHTSPGRSAAHLKAAELRKHGIEV